jgi:FtsH-binding integral membrane protein
MGGLLGSRAALLAFFVFTVIASTVGTFWLERRAARLRADVDNSGRDWLSPTSGRDAAARLSVLFYFYLVWGVFVVAGLLLGPTTVQRDDPAWPLAMLGVLCVVLAIALPIGLGSSSACCSAAGWSRSRRFF